MIKHMFSLTFSVTREKWDINEISNKLYDAGCADSTVFTGVRGIVYVEFHRESETRQNAIHTAIQDIRCAFPAAEILETRSGQLNTTEGYNPKQRLPCHD